MKQPFLLSLVILSLVSCNCKKEQLCTSTWQNTAIVIDGQNNDWGGTLRYSDTTARLRYDVRNDSENLYLIVETDDNSMWMKLMHTGLKISMGLKSDPKATATITLPALRRNPFMHCCQGMPDSAITGCPGPMHEMKDHKCAKSCGAKKDSACAKHCTEMKDRKGSKPCGGLKDSACAKHCKETKDHKGQGYGKPIPDSMCHKGPMPGMGVADSAACMKKHMPMREPVMAEGFKYSNGKIECCHAEKGKISFAVGMNETRTLAYEIAIPLRELYGDGYDLAKVAADKIRLEVAVEAIEKPSGPCMRHKGGPMHGEPGQGHPGEGAPDSLACHHGEKMHGGPEGMQGLPPQGMGKPFALPDTLILFQKQSIQCKVTLATGK
jgi:hypothetical protein